MSGEEIITKHISPSLKKCCCFRDIPEEKYRDVLKCFKARYVSYRKNEMVRMREGDRLAGIVISGKVRHIIYSETGAQINIATYSSGEMFNEDNACSENSEIISQIWALSDCSVLFLNLSTLFSDETVPCRLRKKVAVNLLREIAEKNVRTSEKLRILVQKKIRDRIKVFLQNCTVSENGKIMIPYNRNELADYLCVDRSALSRELGRMQDEGLIGIISGGVVLKKRNFLID